MASINEAFEIYTPPPEKTTKEFKIYPSMCKYCKTGKNITITSNDGCRRQLCSKCNKWSNYGNENEDEDEKFYSLMCKYCKTGKYIIESTDDGNRTQLCSKCNKHSVYGNEDD